MRRAATLALACWGAAACVYYNGMWSAEHLAGEARRLERQDRTAEARSYWAQAAVKAESVVTRHPTSRWADAALVLEGEALARSGACQQAAAPLARADSTVRDEALRERARLATAECALEAGDAGTASRALAGVTESRDAMRRSRAALLAGRAAVLQGDPAAAAEWFRRSAAPGAAAARARALLGAGRVAEACALADTVAAGREPFSEDAWADLLADLRGAAGPDTASRTLDRLVAHRRLPMGVRARLLLADGDALLAAGRPDAAAARYAQVTALVPDSSAGQLARVRAIRVQIVRAETVAELAGVEEQLQRLAADGEGRALAALVHRVVTRHELPDSRRFRLAEVVRDSLAAPRLAAALFLELARDMPSSLFAPKALVAAALVWPEAGGKGGEGREGEGGRRDSILAVLDSAYRGSPYTGALHGALSPAFAAAEDSLARALGLALGPAVPFFTSRVPPPVPGPRGPLLDAVAPPPSATAAVAPLAAPSTAPGRRVRPVAGEDERAGQGQRPVVPRDTL